MNTYLTVKTLHIIAIITWMAALLYLPRLFVYHTQTTDELGQARFKVMERKLYRGIMTPSMIAAWAFGLILAIQGGWFHTGSWLHIKISLVILLSAYHGICGRYVKQFAHNQNIHSERFYRWFNEAPAILLILIVGLVVFKP